MECYRLLNTLHYFAKKEHLPWRFFNDYKVTYFEHFTFLFTLAKYNIYACDVTNLANLDINLAYLGLTKIIVVQDDSGSLFFKDDIEDVI